MRQSHSGNTKFKLDRFKSPRLQTVTGEQPITIPDVICTRGTRSVSCDQGRFCFRQRSSVSVLALFVVAEYMK